LGSKKHTAEEIIGKLRQAEVALAQGIAVPDVCRRLGVTEQTYYRWRKEYGGPSLDHLSPSTELSSAQRSSLRAVFSTRESDPSPATMAHETETRLRALARQMPTTAAGTRECPVWAASQR